jgi:tetratricopeptide (TPR) repeat protein
MVSYKQALTFQPENIDARQNLRATQVRAATERGDHQVVAVAKSLVPVIKAQVLSLIGRNESAILACEEVLTAHPDSHYAMRLLARAAKNLEWYELASWQYQDLLNKHSENDVATMYELIDCYRELDRIDEAIALCDRIREANPNEDVDGLERELAASKTATVYQSGAQKGAHSIVKDEDERRELEVESQIARTDQQRDIKINALHKKLEERPDDYRILMRIADEYYNYEDFQTGYAEGVKALKQAQEIMPSDHNIQAKLGDFEIKRLNREARQAKERVEAGQAQKQEYVDAVKALRKFQIDEYEDRVRRQPLIQDYHHKLGQLYQETKQYDKAVAEFQQSCRDPKYKVDAYTRMGQSFVAMDEAESGVEMLRKAMEGEEVFAKIKDTVYAYGDALEKLGEEEEALKQFSRVFEDDITYKDVRTRTEALRKRIRQRRQDGGSARAEGA